MTAEPFLYQLCSVVYAYPPIVAYSIAYHKFIVVSGDHAQHSMCLFLTDIARNSPANRNEMEFEDTFHNVCFLCTRTLSPLKTGFFY